MTSTVGTSSQPQFGQTNKFDPQQTQQRNLNVDHYLDPYYQPKGSTLKLKDHTEFYASGSPGCKKGVIIIPDTLGWNTGRVRNICDFFGDNDCYAVIPELSKHTTHAGGVSFFESSGIMDYFKSLAFDGNLKPKIVSLVNFMHNEGVEKISLIGFSWGAWVAVNILASDLSDAFVCGALPHPSINLEERLYGGSLPELMSRINRPILLMPARGDPEEYKSYLKLLKYKLPTSDIIDYHNIDHGFLLRGSANDPQIQRACHRSLEQIYSFFDHHFNMDPEDLVRSDTNLGIDSEYTGGKTWYQSVKDSMSRTGEQIEGSINKSTEQMKDSANRTGDRVKDTMIWTGDKMKQGTETVGQSVGETTRQTGEKIKESSHV